MQTETMTYDELAARLGIEVDSARRLARRRRWSKKTGNDGKARVDVPIERLAVTQDSPPEPREASLQDSPAVAIVRLEGEITGLKAVVQAERARADAAAADRDRWHAIATRPWWKRLAG